MKVEIVDSQMWPRVRDLMVESLSDLDFYKDLVADVDERRDFVRLYLEGEHAACKSKRCGLFWCITQHENPCKCPEIGKTAFSHNELIMAAKLKLPAGFSLSDDLMQDKLLPACPLKSLVVRQSKSDEAEASFSEELQLKFPGACDKLRAYNAWLNVYAKEIWETTDFPPWQGNHISVATEHRMRGMGAAGMKAAVQYFSPLADATSCQTLLINTGVRVCRYVCKNAGFQDFRCAEYQGRLRWIMAMDMREVTKNDFGNIVG